MIPTYLKFVTSQIPKLCDPILVTLIKMQPHYIIVNPAEKMRPHPAALPYYPEFYLGYLRGRSLPPPPHPRLQKKKMPSFPQKILLSLQYISNYIGKVIQT